MLTAIIIYFLIGVCVASYEYKQAEEYLNSVRRMYPPWSRTLAVLVASSVITVLWPYVVYEHIRDGD